MTGPQGVTSGAAQAASAPASSGQVIDALTSDQFLKLLITELSNQDPLAPMDNREIMEQLSALRELEANVRLTESLEQGRLAQQVAQASALLGKVVTASDGIGGEISGEVERVLIEEGKVRLEVAGETVSLDQIREIVAGGSET